MTGQNIEKTRKVRVNKIRNAKQLHYDKIANILKQLT